MMETDSEYRLGEGRECSGGRFQRWYTGLLRTNGKQKRGLMWVKAWWCRGKHWGWEKAGNSLWLEGWVLEHSGGRLRSWIKSGFRFVYLNELPVNICRVHEWASPQSWGIWWLESQDRCICMATSTDEI